MAKSIIAPRNTTTIVSAPFNYILKENGEAFFSGGVINSFSNETIKVEAQKVEIGGEYFLNIESKPLSSLVEGAKILNKQELIEKRENSDDLLNISIPIARENNLGDTLNLKLINGNFNFIKKGNEKRMSGFYKNSNVYLSGFCVYAPGGELIQVIKNLEIEALNGDLIFLKLEGSIKRIPFKNDEFYVSGLSVISGSESDSAISGEAFTLRSDQDDIERNISCSFLFPIGKIENGNYITLARGSVKIFISSKVLRYFLEKDGGESIYETSYYYSFYPTFI